MLPLSLEPRTAMTHSETPAAGAAIAGTVAHAITLSEELARVLESLADSRRTLIIQDPHSAWHRLIDELIRELHARLNAASTLRPLGTRAVAKAAGVSIHTVASACAAGDVRAERSDSGEYQVDPEDVSRWLDTM
jgi:hypothetical protein